MKISRPVDLDDLAIDDVADRLADPVEDLIHALGPPP